MNFVVAAISSRPHQRVGIESSIAPTPPRRLTFSTREKSYFPRGRAYESILSARCFGCAGAYFSRRRVFSSARISNIIVQEQRTQQNRGQPDSLPELLSGLLRGWGTGNGREETESPSPSERYRDVDEDGDDTVDEDYDDSDMLEDDVEARGDDGLDEDEDEDDEDEDDLFDDAGDSRVAPLVSSVADLDPEKVTEQARQLQLVRRKQDFMNDESGGSGGDEQNEEAPVLLQFLSPTEYDQDVANAAVAMLRDDSTVLVLNLEHMPAEDAQQFYNFVWGGGFALDRRQERITDNVIMLGPPEMVLRVCHPIPYGAPDTNLFDPEEGDLLGAVPSKDGAPEITQLGEYASNSNSTPVSSLLPSIGDWDSEEDTEEEQVTS